jgi:hypothetical protein
MPKDFSQLHIRVPSFDDTEVLLKACGTIVAKEIVAMIEREAQPDGSAQKQNAPGYREAKRKAKGYTTPLKGIAPSSPYLAREQTFKRTMIDEFGAGGAHNRALEIKLNSRRYEIGKKLTRRGYWFMGITRQAEYLIQRRVLRYFNYKIRQMEGRI